VIAHFTQTDPMPYGAGTAYESAYVYGLNNPLMYVDPSGLRGQLAGCPWWKKNPIVSRTVASGGFGSDVRGSLPRVSSPVLVFGGTGNTRPRVNAAPDPCQYCHVNFERKVDQLDAAVQLYIEGGRVAKDCWKVYHHAYAIAEEVRDQCVADCKNNPEPEPEVRRRRRSPVVAIPRRTLPPVVVTSPRVVISPSPVLIYR
jgi:hypothetical protein